ncbi:integrase/recombinase XerD [Thermocatellispora tengchongensis]|uniref:Integrase/recombinase XerD n=1 Tax=Thermocatellispora tengchongensis TaxID=1073253 RepID=A0A840PGW7_9ACTN|nr:hypothetical protein [Thermocatellispora tengchongensis]MBB5138808.1 integrase/recombinase XerD [Thermocatellispora tengchongensis]
MADHATTTPPPVEYAVAIERYLSTLRLSAASRRVYRIALATWAWPMVGRTPPPGRARRSAVPPVVPLAVLEHPLAGERLREALARRAAAVDARTLGRELSILRGATAWWHRLGWISADPAAGLRAPTPPPPGPGTRLGPAEIGRIFALPVGLREQVLWRLVYESGAPVERVLALNVDDLDLPRRRTRGRAAQAIRWQARTARLLPLLLVGRAATGPLLLTERRAGPATPPRDRCPLTGRARLSYRRAAEIFTAATAPLDPAGRGYTLRDLRTAAGTAATAQPAT